MARYTLTPDKTTASSKTINALKRRANFWSPSRFLGASLRFPGASLRSIRWSSSVHNYERWSRDKTFVGIDLHGCDLHAATLSNLNLAAANLSEADLTLANVHWCCFDGATLNEAKLNGANFFGCSFKGSHIVKATFDDATLAFCDLSDADLSECHFMHTFLRATSMTGTILKAARLGGASLNDIDISVADDSILDTNPYPGVYLSSRSLRLTAEGLRIRPIEYAERFLDWISYAGEPEEILNMMRGWIRSTTGFHTAFISYSRSDREIATRIYAALKRLGIRCWLDEMDLIPGNALDETIRAAINKWDRMIVCCSKASLRPDCWVSREIDIAVEKAQQYGGSVSLIIPVLLDNTLVERDLDGQFIPLREMAGADFRGWSEDEGVFDRGMIRLEESLRKKIDHVVGPESTQDQHELSEHDFLSDAVRAILEHLRTFSEGNQHSPSPVTGVQIKEHGGSYPVQTEGTFHGYPFYFRARWGTWTFTLVEKNELPSAPVSGNQLIELDGEIPGGNERTGKMDDEDVAKILAKCFLECRKRLHLPQLVVD